MLVNHNSNQCGKIHPTMIYLDKGSTYNKMYNEDHLTDVIELNGWICGNCNAKTTSINKKERFGYI